MKGVIQISLYVLVTIAVNQTLNGSTCTTSMNCYEESTSIDPDLHLPPKCQSNEGITFMEGPQDAEVCSGETAYFNCSYEGIAIFPEWLINNSTYSTLALPNNYVYDGTNKELSISQVTVSQNDITIQCFFQIFAERTPLCLIASSIGSLKVFNSSSACACKLTQEAICPCLQDKVTVDPKMRNNAKGRLELEIYCENSDSNHIVLKLELNTNEVDVSKSNSKLVECNSEHTPNHPLLVTFDEVQCDEEYNVSVYIISEYGINLQTPCSSNMTILLPCTKTQIPAWIQIILAFVGTVIVFGSPPVAVIFCCIYKKCSKKKKHGIIHRDLTHRSNYVAQSHDQ